MEQTVELMVNGQKKLLSVKEPAALASVLAALDLKPDRIAVEHNGRIVRRAAWEETPVASGDKLEIVHFVGGGCESDLI